VDSLEPGPGGGFLLGTSAGPLGAASVVVCTGAYQRPHRPEVAGGFPHEVLVLDAQDDRNPTALPPGKVLVVGSGQTGCQLAEELGESGREVVLACGRAPWPPRRPGGRDIVTWLQETSRFDTPLSALPSPPARLGANLLVTGHRGGHDLHYRTLQALGVQLLGRLAGWPDIGQPSPATWPTRSPWAMPATPTSASCSASNSPPGGSRRPSCPTRRPFPPTRRWS
jgi:putative flavoprotein involved in K+ transport